MKNKDWFFHLVLMLVILNINGLFVNAWAQTIGGGVRDIEGNTYKTIFIGDQEWMAENLKTTKYNDGADIPYLTDSIKWSRINSDAYSWYNNNTSYKKIFGAIYNWYAVNTGKLCPAGWHVPTDADWEVLSDFMGGAGVAGGKLKGTGVSDWNPPNVGATNESGFSALPGGYRYGNYWYPGKFYEKGISSYLWSATECNDTHSWSRTIFTGNDKFYRSFFAKNTGFSVRCIKDK
jgi:uncharacterized protein (TIGR02145 family)